MDFNWDKCTGGAYRSINKQLKLHRFDSTMPWAQAVTTKNSPKLLHSRQARPSTTNQCITASLDHPL